LGRPNYLWDYEQWTVGNLVRATWATRADRGQVSFAPLFGGRCQNILPYVGKRFTDETQSYEARLPDGSRVHILLSLSGRDRLSISIRKFSKTAFELNGLLKLKALNEEAKEFLELAVPR
jgi:hypothetical protein